MLKHWIRKMYTESPYWKLGFILRKMVCCTFSKQTKKKTAQKCCIAKCSNAQIELCTQKLWTENMAISIYKTRNGNRVQWNHKWLERKYHGKHTLRSTKSDDINHRLIFFSCLPCCCFFRFFKFSVAISVLKIALHSHRIGYMM